MVTSNQMRRFVPVLLCLILMLGSACSALCIAQASGGGRHSCCHEKHHCTHAGPTFQSHQAIVNTQIVPAVPARLPLSEGLQPEAFILPLLLHPAIFSPPVRTSVLRL